MYASTLGTIFTDQLKPYEVEICIGEVGYPEQASNSVLYRINFDGSIVDERDFVVMGGNTDPISAALKDTYQPGLELSAAIRTAVEALQKSSPDNSDKDKRTIAMSSLEVATLEQARPRRAFRRIGHNALEELLSGDGAGTGGKDEKTEGDKKDPETPSAGDPSNP